MTPFNLDFSKVTGKFTREVLVEAVVARLEFLGFTVSSTSIAAIANGSNNLVVNCNPEKPLYVNFCMSASKYWGVSYCVVTELENFFIKAKEFAGKNQKKIVHINFDMNVEVLGNNVEFDEAAAIAQIKTEAIRKSLQY